MANDSSGGQPPSAGSPGGTSDQPTKAHATVAREETGPKADATPPDINALLAELLRHRDSRNQKKDVWYFLSSGVFFMLVGALVLLAAFLTITTTHASFTFILVVVGVAILLYGTGTQGVGNFENTEGAARYKIGIAGGAGILAFAVGLGIVLRADDIRDAFQVERKYAQLVFRDKGDGVGSLTSYVSEISVDGLPVPAFRSGDYIVAFVPFVANATGREIQINANFYNVEAEQARNRLLAQKISLHQTVALKLDVNDAGFDFPKLASPIVVTLVTDDVKNDPDESQLAGLGQDGGPQPGLPPPAVVAQ